MNDRFYPDGIDWSRGAWFALTHDPYLTHFIHRWWAWVTVAALVLLARRAKKAGARPASIAIHAAFGTQILLGIATVMTNMNIVMAVLQNVFGVTLGNNGALLVMATVFGFGGSFISLMMSKWMAKRGTGAHVVEQPRNEAEQWLLSTVQRLRQRPSVRQVSEDEARRLGLQGFVLSSRQFTRALWGRPSPPLSRFA